MDQLWACELEHLRAYCDRVLTASEETQNAAAVYFANRPDERQILSVDGDTAIIDIRGTLTNRPSIIGSFLGYASTSYIDIQSAVETIAADDSIKNVRLAVDSPGGNVTGLDETWIALRELSESRSIVAENQGLMASAAYWLATAAQKITASSPAAETGSIGVYMLAIDWSKYDERAGIREIRIVSRNAPLKNPDPATAAGLKAYQERLDALERVFISRVATGRRVAVETVEEKFGRGSLLIAQDPDNSRESALSVGMIDSVSGIAAGAGRRSRTIKAEDSGISGDSEAPPPGAPEPAVDPNSNSHIDKNSENVEIDDNSTKRAALAEPGKDRNMAKLAEITAGDPELRAELDAEIEAAEKRGREAAAPPALALTILTGDGPAYLKDLAAKALRGEATEAELKAAQGAIDALGEKVKTDAAVVETNSDGPAPADPPRIESSDGEIKSNEDYNSEVARFRAAHGMEAN